MKCKFYKPCNTDEPQGKNDSIFCNTQRKHLDCCIYNYLESAKTKNPHLLGKKVVDLFDAKIDPLNISQRVGEHEWH